MQATRVKVDYLLLQEARDLMTHPYPDFNLIYEEGVVDKILEKTQGHPALLQAIGFALVNLANLRGTKEISQQDLEQVLDKEILDRENQVMITFWQEFCNKKNKETVLNILKGQPASPDPSLARLKEYGFIIEENSSPKIRVPLMEDWLKRHADSFW